MFKKAQFGTSWYLLNIPNSLEKIILNDDIYFSVLPSNLKELYCGEKQYNKLIPSEIEKNKGHKNDGKMN
jgi:hypothetical protein